MRTAASSLLRIDYDAAIDKLAGAQLQGTWQLPAELARLMIAAGARSVDFDIESRHLSMTAHGASLDQQTIADFASVLDRKLEAADRHRAMVELEEQGAFALAAIASFDLRSTTLTQGGDKGLKLALTTAGELKVHLPGSGLDPDQKDVRLNVDGLSIDAARAAKWLRRAGRFAPIPISIDGAKISRGFRAPLIEKHLEAYSRIARRRPGTLTVTLSIARHGSVPRLWLLRHGIIATHATVPGYPAFEAAVEMAALDAVSGSGPRAPRVTGATLREQLGPYLESLVDASVQLMIELGKRAAPPGEGKALSRMSPRNPVKASNGLPEDVRARVARLLLRSALKRRRVSEVSGVRIFPLLDASGRRLVSIDLVSRLVRVEEGGDCTLDAVSPEEDPARYVVSGRGVLAISQGERALLGELLSVVFSRPPTRARPSLKRRAIDLMVRGLPKLWIRGAVVDSSRLSTAERGLLAQLSAAEAEGAWVGAEFRSGSGRVQRDSSGRLLLPRGNAAVQACVEAVARDSAWLYPATVALLEGRELPGPEVRRQWYARHDR